jgi:undecaprenyl phosphate-alpha-L-ara4FN deformylase
MSEPNRRVGLRVDVDTHEGMRRGVPRLLDLFAGAGVKASFYFSMGPDRSGRAIFQVMRPGFLWKMRRTSAGKIYGWRTMLSGTLLPSRPVATAWPQIARRARDEGHETGVHAWDHRTWQDRLHVLAVEAVREQIDRGWRAYRGVFGEPPRSFAAPAWLTRDEALLHQESLGLAFASDCRGREPFTPLVAGKTLATPQVPATLATLDEALGHTCDDAASFYAALFDDIATSAWPVLTVHAEWEGGPCAGPFADFLAAARDRGIACVPLADLLLARQATGPLPVCRVGDAAIAGRHGVVSMQGAPVART